MVFTVRYKTGDPHPNPALNLTRFVEYDELRRPVWTSVYGDNEAPFRLARLSAQRRQKSKSTNVRSGDTESGHLQDQHLSRNETDARSGRSQAE